MNRINVGITGSRGFIGRALVNFFHIKSEINLIFLNSEDFSKKKKIENFVKNCNVIIHLAAINRDDDLTNLYRTNIRLVKSLIRACEESNSKPKIFFSSSVQEHLDNPYGKSKLKGRILFEKWANNNQCDYATLVIPNVFGPQCKPFYNSVVSTFCFQLINGENPEIKKNSPLSFIYVYDLAEIFYNLITTKKKIKNYIEIKSEINLQVSDLLSKIKNIHNLYLNNHIFPYLENKFDRNLFLTYLGYIPKNYFPKTHILNKDSRGEFSEIVKNSSSGQFSYSVTLPNVIRGNHYHTRKVERFSVIEGSAIVKIRKVNSKEIQEYILNKNNFIDVQPWNVHSIENNGKGNLITLFWISEHYDSNNHDTYSELV